MARFRQFILFACVLCMLLSVAMLTAGCQDGAQTSVPTTTEPTVGAMTEYTITVRTAGGMIPSNVTVNVYEDANMQNLADMPKGLNSQGKYTFTAPARDTYTVVLSGLPEGYDVQEQYTLTSTDMEIVLTSAPVVSDDPTGTNYKLGSVIRDFSVTTPDGTSYKISDILKEKNAVVLNFWYTNCGPCKSEFPYLQAAYELHSDKVEVLALDTALGETNEGVAAFQQEYGLTFPMALADNSWERAIPITGYPTTVVIDRYGVICYMYTGGIEDPAIFRALLRYFGQDDYTQTLIENAEDLITTEDIPYGCKQHPYEVGAEAEYKGEVKVGEPVYYTLYRTFGSILRIEDPEVYMVYNGETYYPENGVIEIDFGTESPFDSVDIRLYTTGDEDKEVILKQHAKTAIGGM